MLNNIHFKSLTQFKEFVLNNITLLSFKECYLFEMSGQITDQLCAISYHTGGLHFDKGHLITYAKYEGQWFEIDDCVVRGTILTYYCKFSSHIILFQFPVCCYFLINC